MSSNIGWFVWIEQIYKLIPENNERENIIDNLSFIVFIYLIVLIICKDFKRKTNVTSKKSLSIFLFTIYNTAQSSSNSDNISKFMRVFKKCAKTYISFIKLFKILWTSIKTKGYKLVKMKLQSCIPIKLLVVICIFVIFSNV